MPLYVAQAHGFRTVIEATFMIGCLVTGTGVSEEDVTKYLDRDQVDVRAFGTGERIVFLPYSQGVYAVTQERTQARQLFPDLGPFLASYDQATLSQL